MEALHDYLKQHDRPVALYADKHAIFRVKMKDCDAQRTQFARACKTLQDRLVKELRLQGINDIEKCQRLFADLYRRL